MEAAEIKDWVGIVLGLIAVVGTVYTWVTARSAKNTAELSGLHEDHQVLAAKVAAIETEIAHMPSKDMVHTMEIAIAKIERDIHAMAQAFEGIQRTANRIEGHLMNRPVKDPS